MHQEITVDKDTLNRNVEQYEKKVLPPEIQNMINVVKRAFNNKA